MFRCMTPGAIGVKGTFEEQLNFAKAAGFEGMDVGLGPLGEMAKKMGVDGIKELFRKAGLRVGGAAVAPGWRASEADHKALLEALPAQAEAAAKVGATGCMTWITPQSETMPFRENFRFHANRLRPVAQILKDHGLKLGLEPVSPRTSRDGKKYGFIYTMAGMLGLAEAIGTGNVGLLVDSWHWYTALGTASDLAMLTADDVVHVHINDAPAGVLVEKQLDNTRALPGETGVIDLSAFLQCLKKIGYQGAVSPEPFSAKLKTMTPEQCAKTVGDCLMRVWKAAGV